MQARVAHQQRKHGPVLYEGHVYNLVDPRRHAECGVHAPQVPHAEAVRRVGNDGHGLGRVGAHEARRGARGRLEAREGLLGPHVVHQHQARAVAQQQHASLAVQVAHARQRAQRRGLFGHLECVGGEVAHKDLAALVAQGKRT